MLPILTQALASDDVTLFSEGACHIFADELYRHLAAQGFKFRRLDDRKMSTRYGRALHVYLAKDDRLIDVKGIRGERDLIAELHAIRESGHWVSNLQPFDCERDELFKPIPWHNDSEHGVRNTWGLYLDPEFVGVCRKRASQLIARRLEVYIPAV